MYKHAQNYTQSKHFDGDSEDNSNGKTKKKDREKKNKLRNETNEKYSLGSRRQKFNISWCGIFFFFSNFQPSAGTHKCWLKREREKDSWNNTSGRLKIEQVRIHHFSYQVRKMIEKSLAVKKRNQQQQQRKKIW